MGWQDYGPNIWGLTACDGPANIEHAYRGEKRRFKTYWARGVSSESIRDDGTIAPTAAGGSIAFAPEIVLPALRTMIQRYGEDLYNANGFVDAFNPSFRFETVPLRHGQLSKGKGWFDREHLGIDQGPILLMIENHRSEMVWKVMKRSPYIRRGLERAGFGGGWLESSSSP